MDYAFDEVKVFDGRWQSMPGIDGPVRTGPRGRRYWDTMRQGLCQKFVPPQWPLEKHQQDTTTSREVGKIGDFANDQELSKQDLHSSQPEVDKMPIEPTITPDLVKGSAATTNIKMKITKRTGEWKKIRKTMDQDSYQRQVKRATSNEALKTATAARLGNIVKYLNAVLELTTEDSDTRRKNAYEKVRDWILDMHHSHVNQEDLKDKNVIHHIQQFLEHSTTQIQTQDKEEVWIEEELTAVKRKWERGDLSSDPKRGLIVCPQRDTNDESSRLSYRIDKSWEQYQNGNYFGEGDLVNGQTWFSRLELLRDGVHATPQGGIAGTPDGGAYSIVMSYKEATGRALYANIDDGETIEYMGTALSAPKASEPKSQSDSFEPQEAPEDPTLGTTACTAAMKKSLKTKKPVRVIRRFKVDKSSGDLAIHGYRYDGLYEVVGETLVSEPKQEWRFKLVRLPGQGPLRQFHVKPEPKAGNCHS